MTRIRAALALLPLFCGACHAYAPASPTAVGPGDQVRALLTAEQFDHFREVLPTDARSVEGTVLEAVPGELLLEVPILVQAEGLRVEPLRQRLRIPETGLADLELRTLARGRTWALTGVVAGLVGYVVWDQWFADADRSPQAPPGTVNEFWRVVIPVPR